MFSTYESGAPSSDLVTSNATATALYSRAELYQNHVSTALAQCASSSSLTMRRPITSSYRKRVPLLYTFAMKFADYMGAGSGKWNGDKNPTGAPWLDRDKIMTDISHTAFRPVDQKVLDWNVGELRSGLRHEQLPHPGLQDDLP